jgi:hypothetical protein
MESRSHGKRESLPCANHPERKGGADRFVPRRVISMVTTKDRRPARSGHRADGQSTFCTMQAPSASANTMAGCKTVPIRTHTTAPSNWLAKIRRRASLQMRRLRWCGKSWVQSATPAPSVRPIRRPRAERRRRGSFSTAETLLHALADIADLLDSLLHRRSRPSGFLRLIFHFVVLPTSNARPILLAPARRLLHCRYLTLLCSWVLRQRGKDSAVPCGNVSNCASLNRPVA